MRQAPPDFLRRMVAPAPVIALAGAVLAQDVPPEDIGTDLLGIAREAVADGAVASDDPAVADVPPLVGVPHPLGGTEIVPVQESVAEAAPEPLPAAPAVQDEIPALPVVAGTDPAEPGSPLARDAGITTAPPEVPAPAPADETAERDVATTDRPKPLDLLMGLWREAVASGDTSEGFEAWLSAELRPEPEAPAVPGSQATLTREVAVAWDRRTSPVTLGDAGRVVTTFGAAIPVAHCSPLTVCYIELEPGEELTDTPSVGDAVRWQVQPKQQGWDPVTVVLEIKPAADAVDTNLVIPTDRRLYTINLVNDPEYHTPIVSFRWPDSEARAIADEIERQRAEELVGEEVLAAEAAARADIAATEMARSGVPTESGPRAAELLDFRFKVEGKAAFRPVRVFADGSRTYFDFHPQYRGPLPAIVAGKAEGNAALNTRVSASGTRLVADRVVTDVWLQSGRERVRIRRITN